MESELIVKVVQDFFSKKLNDKGKPQPNEWAILACLLVKVKKSGVSDEYTVVSLGTGNRCIGKSSLSSRGDVLNDSHAEVICKRSFQRYLYNEIQLSLKDPERQSLVIELNKNNSTAATAAERIFKIREDVEFHFYVSHTPCGDCSIFPVESFDDSYLKIKEKNKSTANTSTGVNNANDEDLENETSGNNTFEEQTGRDKKRVKVDIQRTGAKTVEGEKMDARGEGADYHSVGSLRTKPGRGDQTDSMSCSDKIARWNALGIQGSLLSNLIESPVHLASITVGDLYHQESLKRGLIDRISHYNSEPVEADLYAFNSTLQILQGKSIFELSKLNPKKNSSSGYSINYSHPNIQESTISSHGKKMGFTDKNLSNPKSFSRLCKLSLFQEFQNILSTLSTLEEYKKSDLLALIDKNYHQCKSFKNQYNKSLEKLKSNLFKNWKTNPRDLLLFNHK